MWTVTGLIMVWHPIEYVRGDHLRNEVPVVSTELLIMPQLPPSVRSVTLQGFADGPGWIVVEEDGGRYRYSAADGRLYNPVLEEGAREIATATYAGEAALEAVTYFPADASPMDLRTPGKRLAGALCRRYPHLHRRADRRGAGGAQRLVADFRFHVGPAHHGPAGRARIPAIRS